MTESNFYLTEYKEQEFPIFNSQATKKTIFKAFKEWPKVMKSVTQYLLPQEYYANKSFKPGIDVYRALLNENGPFLKQFFFNIPLTLTGQPYTYDVIHSHGGQVIRKMQVNQQQIQGILNLKTASPHYQSSQSLQLFEQFMQSSESPLFITKISDDRIGCKTTVITLGQYKHKLKTLPKRQEEIYQKFVVPYQFKANIIRLHLYTLRSKKQTLTNAIKILNRIPMYDSANKSVQSLMFCVNFTKQDSFDTVQLKGKPLKSYIDMTQSLVNYLQEYFGICITQIVTDYTMDYHKVPWFLSLKSLKYTTKMIKDVKLTVEQLEQLSLSTMCKLCGLYYTKQQVSKLVTYKLIYGFLNHIKSRGIEPDLIVPKSNPNLQCKICKTCYKIILKQIQLYKLSTQLAKIQNTIQTVDDITDITNHSKNILSKSSQYRWRMMINITGLKNAEELTQHKSSDLQLQIKVFGMKMKIPLFKNQRNIQTGPFGQFSIGQQCLQSNNYLSKSIGKQSTTLNIQSKQYRDYTQQQSTQLKYLKTIYFFSKQKDISELLKDEQIIFGISKNKDSKKMICEGNSRILGYLTSSKEQGQIYGTEVYMFFQNMKYLKLQLSIGLACDGIYEVPQNQKIKYKQINIVKGNYYVCQPLPINWLQLFDQQ